MRSSVAQADSPETCGGSVTADAERPETAAERAEDAEDLEAANSTWDFYGKSSGVM